MSAFDVIDVWDAATFDGGINVLLRDNDDLIKSHVDTENANFLIYDHNDGPDRPSMRPDNPHYGRFLKLQEALGALLESRTIRVWHYTRMTDDEVIALRRDGIYLSTPDTLAERLNALVASGVVTRELADNLIAHSPFNGDQRTSRSGKFWFTSHPDKVGDSGVSRLLRYWGGEVASFWTDDPALLEPIGKIGHGRVVEVAVPLASTKHSFGAAASILATHARALGCVESSHAFDVFIVEPLPGSAVLKVTTEGDADFTAIGDTYPAGFIDVDLTHWELLTGETD